ncbi:MAG: aminotransferase class I/II-fold pyridoxal phosphate-dependent enzyme [Octadecabacter sp.]|nr:aminotransferase class I/II-fold pyridoxal phosphate-dependent enzyme [Octadecabacter sp.]
MKFANRMANIISSQSLSIIAEVKELRRTGVDVVDFGQQGNTPTIARVAAGIVINDAEGSFYSNSRGLPILRQEIADKLSTENGFEADPDTNIIITVGAKQGILTALLALIDRDDEVLLDDPGWISFAPMVQITGATPIAVPLVEENSFRSTTESFRQRITARTKLIILCNPHNPTGRCLSREELSEIATLAQEFDLFVLMDEAYEHFSYDNKKFVSMASLPGMAERTITAQTVSKIYNMAGWRVGWVVANRNVIDRMLAIHTHLVSCPTTFAQAGVAAVISAGIGEGDLPLGEIVANYETQRNSMVNGLRNIDGLSCFMPEGAFFAFPNIKKFGKNSVDMSRYLLDQARVSTIPGSAFGEGGEGHVRVVFKTNVKEIERGLHRIAEALSKLKFDGK